MTDISPYVHNVAQAISNRETYTSEQWAQAYEIVSEIYELP